MKIDKYETIIENGNIAFYAVIGKKKIRMPDAFKEMYTDDYLDIQEVEFKMPEVFGLSDPKSYIPRRTSA